ncbi:hypothetical protein SAMN02745125_01346 [Campylobacter helveticus]|nr:hypothetical protein SAMN02745125_01346 [Campylobacter helveticus]SUW87703.1 Uncharacterised protein [Campylobacter helveticus]
MLTLVELGKDDEFLHQTQHRPRLRNPKICMNFIKNLNIVSLC